MGRGHNNARCLHVKEWKTDVAESVVGWTHCSIHARATHVSSSSSVGGGGVVLSRRPAVSGRRRNIHCALKQRGAPTSFW